MCAMNNSPQDYSHDPDVKLMLSFQDGNKAAFEELMHKFYPRILNFIYRYVGRREVAEDLTQEVFIKIYDSAHKYTPQSKFQTWAYTIAKNTSLNELRRAEQKNVSMDAPVRSQGEELQRQVADQEAELPDEEMIKEEKAKMVREAIKALPDNQRIAVILRRYDQFSYEEIAQTMKTTVKAVKSLLSRAKENLREKLTHVNK